MATKDIKKALTKVHEKHSDPIPESHFLRTGSTLLDLAISGSLKGGFTKGRYFWMVGDSSSGKTFLMLTCFAEACRNPEFDNYRLIYDNGEDGALMDMNRYFGSRMAARLEPPATENGMPVYSETIEDFYFNIDDALNEAEKTGKPFIYGLDSMDNLGSKYSEAKFQEAKNASRGGKKAKGDYGDGKAKINSTRIRSVISRLRKTGSILIILSQTRDVMDAGIFDEKQTFAGGHALKFYSTVQLWSSVADKIKKTVRDREMVVGVNCRVKIKKNRITGKERQIMFPIYYDSGIDDTGGMVDFLVYWGHWKKDKAGRIDAGEFECKEMLTNALIAWIEENDKVDQLRDITKMVWDEVEEKAAVNRKPRYE